MLERGMRVAPLRAAHLAAAGDGEDARLGARRELAEEAREVGRRWLTKPVAGAKRMGRLVAGEDQPAAEQRLARMAAREGRRRPAAGRRAWSRSARRRHDLARDPGRPVLAGDGLDHAPGEARSRGWNISSRSPASIAGGLGKVAREGGRVGEGGAVHPVSGSRCRRGRCRRCARAAWPRVAAAMAGCSPATCWPSRSSSVTRPCSRSFMMPAAVNVLECEATRNRWRGVSGLPAARSAWPSASPATTAPRCATASDTPGCSSARIW